MAAPAAPTAVFFPAGPVTRHAPIELLAADVVVTSTPFLDWEPTAAVAGAPPRMSLRLALATRAFVTRCKSSRLPADVAAARNASPYRWRFTTAFWARLFDELKVSGVFAAPLTSLRALDDVMKTCTVVNPAQLEVAAADWALTPDFTIPPGAGAAAVARRAVMAPMRYLHLVSAYSLEMAGPVPYLRLAELAGYLGGCATVVAREDEAGLTRTAVDELRRFCGPADLADGARARAVPAALDRLRLPAVLGSISLGEDDLGQELTDGIAYRSSSVGEKAVIEQRVLCLGPRCIDTLTYSPRASSPRARRTPLRPCPEWWPSPARGGGPLPLCGTPRAQ